MKNVTIGLAGDTARWASLSALDGRASLSAWVVELLARDPMAVTDQRADVERFLAGPDLTGAAGDPGWREELYAERLFRGHERVPVRPRSKVSGEA